mmetsp:Transcript_18255/g.17375  ORF Transcript_18255/g.17375 Transcript_18255/m.17375 type:complete len:129 (+) Transcript_18255:1845-2231(+)
MVEPGKDQSRTKIKKLERIEYKFQYLAEARDYMLSKEETGKACLDEEKEIDVRRRIEKVQKMKQQEKEDLQKYILKNEERTKRNLEKIIQKGTKSPMKRSQKEEPIRKKKKNLELTEEQKDFVKYVLT